MLRRGIPTARALSKQRPEPISLTQWQTSSRSRGLADSRKSDETTKSSLRDPKPPVLPGTSSTSASRPQPPPPGSIPSISPVNPAKPSSDSAIPPENVPRVPPTPPKDSVQTSPTTSVPPVSGSKPPVPVSTSSAPPPPPPSSSPPPPRRRSRLAQLRRLILGLILFGGLAFGGSVYYSLVSDNFHDFFTEYVPFGEEAVLYFEEREFRKRFPNITNTTSRPLPAQGKQITIPSNSGVSWRVADDNAKIGGTDLEKKGPHMSDLQGADRSKAATAQQSPSQASKKEKVAAVEQTKKDAKPPVRSEGPSEKKQPVLKNKAPEAQPKLPTIDKSSETPPPKAEGGKPSSTQSTSDAFKRPEVDEPNKFMPIEPIDPLKIKNANEPLVQDLVKMLNDIIQVVNNDGASFRYSSSIRKAKESLATIGQRIINLQKSEQDGAAEKIRSMQSDFDNGAKELVRRLEEEIKTQEGRWQDDFAAERERLTHSYQDRLDAAIKRNQEVVDQRVRNELLEQAVTMKKQFLSEVVTQVDNERSGRLAKLSDLASNVHELERLTADWNKVVDSNLRTQHLQVAIEAVRSTLETADRPRPFVRELAALKDISGDDPVIGAALSTISPSAYQRGIPTLGQLVDRFRRVAAEVRKAALLPQDGGVASHAASAVLSQLMFKKKGMAPGEDVESILTRAETFLEEGNLDEAAREINTLDGWAKTLSHDWLSECRRVLEVRQAMEVITAEARLEALKVDT